MTAQLSDPMRQLEAGGYLLWAPLEIAEWHLFLTAVLLLLAAGALFCKFEA
jgi:hypothetical protein